MGKLKTKNYKFSHYLVMRLLLCAMLLTGSAGVWADQKTAKWDAHKYLRDYPYSSLTTTNDIQVSGVNLRTSNQKDEKRNFQFEDDKGGSITVTAPSGYRVRSVKIYEDYKGARPFSIDESTKKYYSVTSDKSSCLVTSQDAQTKKYKAEAKSITLYSSSDGDGTNFRYLEVVCVKESPTLQSSYKGYVGSSLKLSEFDGHDVTFTSSDPSIADCSGNTLYLKAKGKATITATVNGNANFTSNESSMSVEVMQSDLSASLSYTSKTYNAWDAMVAPTLTTPSDYKGAISYSSSNTSIVKVDKDGNISFGGSVYGKTATITVSLAAAGKYKAATLSYQITINEIKNCLKFTAEQAGSTISFNASGNGGSGNVQMSKDGFTWKDYTRGTKITLEYVGDKVYFKGDYRGSVSNYSKFAMTGKIAASGNIMTLTDGHNPTTSLKDKNYVFFKLFENCRFLTSAPALPATELSRDCYNEMFIGCTSLTSAPALPATTLPAKCYFKMFEGCTKLTSAPTLPTTTMADYCYAYMFNGCTSLASAPTLPATELADWCYYNMFNGCTSLTSAPALPATKLDTYCYSYMFSGCTKLTTAPALPATTLAKECYRNMFSDCTSLTSAPALPATELADWCYQYMFSGCTSLTSAPALPATKLAYYCYYNMFDGCKKLNSIKVAFTDWNDEGYSTSWWLNGVASAGTFICKAELAKEFSKDRIPEGWTVQELPEYLCFTAEEANSTISFKIVEGNGGAGNIQTSTNGITWSDYTRGTTITLKNVGDKVYFKGDYRGTNYDSYSGFSMAGKIAASGNIMTLTDDDNPTTSLKGKNYAFFELFRGCTSLTSAPALPATTLADYCYDDMFRYCTSLTSAPALPATELADYCYNRMFWNCTSLTSAPALPATTLAISCYRSMFYNCTSLTSAPALPATELAIACYRSMFYNCTSLTSAPALPATTLATNCYRSMFGGCNKLNSIKVAFTDWNSATEATSDWVKGVSSTGTFICPAELAKEFGNNRIPEGWTVQELPYLCFTAKEANSTISFNAYRNGGSGNVQTSTDGFTWSDYTRGTTITLKNVGDKVYFKGDYWGTSFSSYSQFAMKGKIAASGNIMTLTDGHNPTTSLKDKDHAFSNLFEDCTALISAPALPATTLADHCYYNMFSGCTSLTSAPALPATTLATSCYSNMFYGCTSLTSAPVLPATTLADHCYWYMFDGCTNLNSIKVAFTDWNTGGSSTSWWVNGVASTGTFICPAELAKEYGRNRIPNGWTVKYDLPRSYRYTTFSSNLATDFSGSGLTPYYVSGKNEARTSVILKSFENGIVPAGQGAVLYNADITDGTSENFTVEVASTAGTTPAVNYLKPALTAIDFPSASSAEEAGYKYMLGDEDKWWWINGGTLAAGKAYLDLSSNPSAAKSFIMSFDEETTAISSISNEKLGISNSADAYNLAGQRVSKDYKGIVIKNGKKFKN